MNHDINEPKYMISIISKMLGIHPQTIRTYEKLGLLTPSRSQGNTRLFSESDISQMKKILALTRDMGVNLAGVEIILKLRSQIDLMQTEFQSLIDFLREELTKEDRDLSKRFDTLLVRAPKQTIVHLRKTGTPEDSSREHD